MDAQAAGNNVTCLGAVRAAAASRDGGAALPSLAGSALSGRYCAWRGGSDRRYVTSVYPVDPSAFDAGLPEFSNFVLLAVTCRPDGRRILDVCAIERDSDRHAAVAHGLASGADEWHVHLLGEDRRARAALVADLLARHGAAGGEARCA